MRIFHKDVPLVAHSIFVAITGKTAFQKSFRAIEALFRAFSGTRQGLFLGQVWEAGGQIKSGGVEALAMVALKFFCPVHEEHKNTSVIVLDAGTASPHLHFSGAQNQSGYLSANAQR